MKQKYYYTSVQNPKIPLKFLQQDSFIKQCESEVRQ